MRLLALAAVAGCGHGFFDPQPPDAPRAGDGALATIEFVQGNYTTSSGMNFISLDFPIAQRPGDLAVAIVYWSAGPALSNIHDTAGNTWNVAVSRPRTAAR